MRTDLYNILEISSDASQQEIKAAMTKLSKKYATRGQIDHSARLRFNQIKEAYQVISNPYRRANYDNFLQQHEEVKNNKKILDIESVKDNTKPNSNGLTVYFPYNQLNDEAVLVDKFQAYQNIDFSITYQNL